MTVYTKILTRSLPGLDIKAGLAISMGKEALYRRLLKKFSDGQADFVWQFTLARSDADPSAATRAAHSLKGSAGNIGAKALYEAAGRLESACLAMCDETSLSNALSDVQRNLRIACSSIEIYLGENEDGWARSDKTTVDPAKVGPLLSQLELFLNESDSRASELAESVEQMLRGTQHGDTARHIRKLTDACDFEQALGQLQQFQKVFIMT